MLASNNVGENNKGYLEILKPLADKGQEKTVADENSDRK
ncbi:MAG: YdbL family protein, partial [Lentisphaerae bacterium]|nr:YdbL family protein [Lentisphaerota bacterium]